MIRVALLSLVAIVGLQACGSDGGAESDSDRSEETGPVVERTAVISGTVIYPGEIPPPQIHEVASDPYCGEGGRISTIEVIDVNGEMYGGVDGDGTERVLLLQDAFVWISDGLEGARFAYTDDTITIVQKSCRLSPRVVGVRAGQPIRFVNEDGTLMNVHARTAENGAFNIGLEEGGSEVVVFEKPELFVPIGSDIHAWMRSWIGVLDHPCFDVTDHHGEFTIDVPPGSYTISARHERLGRIGRTVEVRAGDTASIEFEFGA